MNLSGLPPTSDLTTQRSNDILRCRAVHLSLSYYITWVDTRWTWRRRIPLPVDHRVKVTDMQILTALVFLHDVPTPPDASLVKISKGSQ